MGEMECEKKNLSKCHVHCFVVMDEALQWVKANVGEKIHVSKETGTDSGMQSRVFCFWNMDFVGLEYLVRSSLTIYDVLSQDSCSLNGQCCSLNGRCFLLGLLSKWSR